VIITEFTPFPKIPRLFRRVFVTEKLDGTNACVVVPEDPTQPVLAQSRTRFITPEADNYGFADWVSGHETGLRNLGPGRHFGEWWGAGINRGYGLEERRFSLFNVSRWDSKLFGILDAERMAREAANWRQKNKPAPDALVLVAPREFVWPPKCCSVVPLLGIVEAFDMDRIQELADVLRRLGSIAAPGYNNPEGIVAFHERAGQLFKFTFDGDGAKGVA
jgi:hypothetical protein